MKTFTRKPIGAAADEALPARRPAGDEVVPARRRARDWADRMAAVRDRYGLAVLVVAAVGIVAAGQLTEDLADGSLQLLRPSVSIRRWAIIAVVLYEVVMLAYVLRTTQRALAVLRPSVRIDGPAFEDYERRTRCLSARVDLLLLLLSAALSALIFLVLGIEPLDDDPLTEAALALPAAAAPSLIVLAGYTVLGWAGLRLIYVTARLARLLGRLSREPLDINVFDTSPLLPFGNIALLVAFAPAGVIVILLIGLGPPIAVVGWLTLVVATVASLLALLLPLRGIHGQMSAAKDAALTTLNSRISDLYEDVARNPRPEPAEMTRYRDGAGALIPLRKTAEEMTTWPFRDTVAFGRAMLIASAPLIYTTLSELIRIFLIGPLNPNR